MIRARLQASPDYQEDLIADVMLAIVRNLRAGKYSPEKGPIESYLAGIVRFKIADHLKLRTRLAENQLPQEHLLPAADFRSEQRDLRNALRIAIRQLDKKYQEVLVLKYFEDKPVDEIARQLKIRPGQVYNRIHYGLGILRHIAGEYL